MFKKKVKENKELLRKISKLEQKISQLEFDMLTRDSQRILDNAILRYDVMIKRYEEKDVRESMEFRIKSMER